MQKSETGRSEQFVERARRRGKERQTSRGSAGERAVGNGIRKGECGGEGEGGGGPRSLSLALSLPLFLSLARPAQIL